MAKAAEKIKLAVDPFAASGEKMASGFAVLSKFKPWPDNARMHPKEELDLLAQILKMRGADQPIVVDEDWWIIKGHGRLAAAKAGKLKGFPYVQRFGLSEADKRAMRIEDNQVALLAQWDQTLLRADVSELKLLGYDVALLGFGEQMTSWLIAGELVQNSSGEWNGMPGFEQDDKTAFRSIVVHFKDQAAVNAFGKLTKQKISPKTRMMWYPEIEIETYADKRYTAKK